MEISKTITKDVNQQEDSERKRQMQQQLGFVIQSSINLKIQ